MNLKKTFVVSHFLLIVGWVVQLIAAIALIEPVLQGGPVGAFAMVFGSALVTFVWLLVTKIKELMWYRLWRRFLRGDSQLADMLINEHLLPVTPKSMGVGHYVDSTAVYMYAFIARNECEIQGLYLVFGRDDPKVWVLPMEHIPEWVVKCRAQELILQAQSAFKKYRIVKPLT